MVKGVRYRYLAIKVESKERFPKDLFMRTLINAVSRLYGLYGLSKTTLSLIEYNEDKRYAIIRCDHSSVDLIRSSVASVTKINEIPVYFRTVLISGTLKTLRRKLSESLEKNQKSLS
ncbi:hypothetical protein CW709_04950 [Candidatus Bathyarchaeota archaeon]|nr:MAG: hypothetical protein CW709_04950 [Candidatus Bathyarchaeota archaeon]